MADTIRKRPAASLKYWGLIVMNPPKNDIGNAVIIKGIKIFLSKQPSLINLIEAMIATTLFKISEVVLIVSGVNDNNAIIAR